MKTILILLMSITSYSQTKDSVYSYIIEIGIKHPSICMKQCLYESGHLKSKRCKEDHNLFGMKHPRQRETTSLGVRRGHAYYSNWKESVNDYLLWQNKYYKGVDYYKFLSRVGYSTNEKYISTLKSIKL